MNDGRTSQTEIPGGLEYHPKQVTYRSHVVLSNTTYMCHSLSSAVECFKAQNCNCRSLDGSWLGDRFQLLLCQRTLPVNLVSERQTWLEIIYRVPEGKSNAEQTKVNYGNVEDVALSHG
eukprot:3828312-Amphidinium_carterae.1